MRVLKELEDESDYELVNGSVWLMSGNLSIWIMPFGEDCVRIMVFPKGEEMDDAIDEMVVTKESKSN